jgi:hypothetical protein
MFGSSFTLIQTPNKHQSVWKSLKIDIMIQMFMDGAIKMDATSSNLWPIVNYSIMRIVILIFVIIN